MTIDLITSDGNAVSAHGGVAETLLANGHEPRSPSYKCRPA